MLPPEGGIREAWLHPNNPFNRGKCPWGISFFFNYRTNAKRGHQERVVPHGGK